jgi:AraC-like DNA-binding protein
MTHHALDSEHCAMITDANRLTRSASESANGKGAPPTIPASILRPFADALTRLGFEVPSLLSAAGLQLRDLDDPDALFPARVLDQVLCGAMTERRYPDLAARLALATPIGAFPLLDYLVVTTDTVGGALEQLVRYFHLVCAPLMLRLDRDDRAIRLIIEAGDNAFVAQYDAVIAVNHLRTETENRIRVSCVSLTHLPDDKRELERLVGCPVTAPATWNGVEFPREVETLPLRRRDSALRQMLESHAASIGKPTASENGSIVATLRAALASRVGSSPTIEALARQLAVSPRTLQRRLAAEGVSFQQVVDDVRREAAERLLANASLAVGEIGYLLGFSEPSAFHRAFRRWHDVTPQDFRQRLTP